MKHPNSVTTSAAYTCDVSWRGRGGGRGCGTVGLCGGEGGVGCDQTLLSYYSGYNPGFLLNNCSVHILDLGEVI